MRERLFFVLIIIILCEFAYGQSENRTGWGWGGVPAINYNADDGFGYGVLVNFFNYRDGGYNPYYYKIKTQIFKTTGGKQDHILFFDSPYLLGKGLRFNVRLRYKTEDYFSYFGLGNDTKYDSEFIETDDDDNPTNPDKYKGNDYYTSKSKQIRLLANLQKALIYGKNDKPKLSALVGLGILQASGDINENDAHLTKLSEDLANDIISQKEIDGGMNNYLKFGLIYDTRDNEPAPNSGAWSSILSEFYTKYIGSDFDFVRLTLTDRRYFSITKKLVYANRFVYEKCFGDAPFIMYYPYGSSMKADEGLGGNKSIRGIFKNRFIGPEKMFLNMELRYKFFNFNFANQDFYLAANVFYDLGRVWHENDEEKGLKNLHAGKGLGLHIGWNDNFIISIDNGFSEDAGSQLYIDVGYMF